MYPSLSITVRRINPVSLRSLYRFEHFCERTYGRRIADMCLDPCYHCPKNCIAPVLTEFTNDSLKYGEQQSNRPSLPKVNDDYAYIGFGGEPPV